jgi:hypothetical protein
MQTIRSLESPRFSRAFLICNQGQHDHMSVTGWEWKSRWSFPCIYQGSADGADSPSSFPLAFPLPTKKRALRIFGELVFIFRRSLLRLFHRKANKLAISATIR